MSDIFWATPNKRFVFAWRQNDGRDWREGAVSSTVKAFDKWDRKMKRKFGLMRTLRWFAPTNQPETRTMIVALHWPHKLCWSWTIDWSKVTRECAGFKVTCAYRHFSIVFWQRQLSYHWQDDTWMAASPYRGEAPKVIWAHSIESDMYQGRQSRPTDSSMEQSDG